MIALLERNDSGKQIPTDELTRTTIEGTASPIVPLIAKQPVAARTGGIKLYILRRLRVLLTPLFYRIELRARSAIEKTGLAANIFEVRTSITAMQREIQNLRVTSEQMSKALEQSRSAARSAHSGSTSYGVSNPLVTPLGDGLVGAQSPFGLLVVHHSSPALRDLLIDRAETDQGGILILQELLNSGDRMLSVGVGIGFLELAAAKLLGHTGSVIVCDPSEHAVKAMQVAASVNRVSDIVQAHALAFNSGDSDDDRATALERMLQSFVPARKTIALVKIELNDGELDMVRAVRRIFPDNLQMNMIVKLAPGTLVRSGTTAESWLNTIGSLGLVARRLDSSSFAARAMGDADFDEAETISILLTQQSSAVQMRPPLAAADL